ncbi:MAG: hypothetical protein IJN42_01075 [Clostridia bacterium]|nr:hypothetical protein [Clostridia bacterium]
MMAKRLKTLFREMLEEPVTTAEGVCMTRRDALVLAVIEKAMKGDLPAVNFIKEMTEKKGEKKERATEEVVRVRVLKE